MEDAKPRRNQLLDILSSTISKPKSFEVEPKNPFTPNIFGKKLKNHNHTNNNNSAIHENTSKLVIDYQTTPEIAVDDENENRDKYWINQRDILVNGYIHHQQKLNKIPLSIPKDIINMIISWSFTNDIWCQYGIHVSKHMDVLMSKQTIERVTDCHQHCYYSFGQDKIDKNSGIKEWKIKIDKIEYYTNNYCSMLIGIVETNKINWIKSLLGDFTYGVYKGYGLRVAIKSRFVHQHSKRQIFMKTGNLRKGDIIKMKLDLSSQNNKNDKYGKLLYQFEDGCGDNIQYGINDEFKWLGLPQNVAFDKINRHKSYSLVVGMYCRNKLTFLEDCNFSTI